ncbi:hypothetical protein EGR_05287 [Echinococcus granulosus]|uniref:Uncharacterized protein n=1 Tax=Echinococcus granulosus TaxID=6210 RepID=W6UFT9_ECHGR|nr:hypothetical protein EGR_05287 [Echinococcus granulosus]EUB59811.1 hypothetical protein EGR_05287 [Echinococcus granulosus]
MRKQFDESTESLRLNGSSEMESGISTKHFKMLAKKHELASEHFTRRFQSYDYLQSFTACHFFANQRKKMIFALNLNLVEEVASFCMYLREMKRILKIESSKKESFVESNCQVESHNSMARRHNIHAISFADDEGMHLILGINYDFNETGVIVCNFFCSFSFATSEHLDIDYGIGLIISTPNLSSPKYFLIFSSCSFK